MQKENLKVYYWKGWISSESMENKGWFESWKNSAQQAESEDYELIVFRVPIKTGPNKHNFEIIEEIEQHLQARFGEPENKYSEPVYKQAK